MSRHSPGTAAFWVQHVLNKGCWLTYPPDPGKTRCMVTLGSSATTLQPCALGGPGDHNSSPLWNSGSHCGGKCPAAVPFLSNTGLGGPKIAHPGTSVCPGSGASGLPPTPEGEPAFLTPGSPGRSRPGLGRDQGWGGMIGMPEFLSPWPGLPCTPSSVLPLLPLLRAKARLSTPCFCAESSTGCHHQPKRSVPQPVTPLGMCRILSYPL